MDITAIIYAAIGGGGGALLGRACASFFSKPNDNSDAEKTAKNVAGVGAGLAGGLTVAGALILPMLYRNMVLPRIVPLDETEFLESLPVYKVIKEQSPEDYKRMTVPLDRISRRGSATQEDLNKMRDVLFELIAEKQATANAAILQDKNGVLRLQYIDFKEKEPKLCTLTINGEPFPAVSNIMSEDIAKLEQEVMVKLFTEAPRDPNFVPDLERGKEVFDKIAAEAVAASGVNNLRPEILETAANRVKHQNVCDFGKSFVTKQMALEDADLFNVTAYMESLE